MGVVLIVGDAEVVPVPGADRRVQHDVGDAFDVEEAVVARLLEGGTHRT